MAIAATAKRPAATDPTFLEAAPVKPDDEGLVPDPVFEGATTGAIGEPVAAPAPELVPAAPVEAADVPVATGVVPVMNPVEPAATEELGNMSAQVSWSEPSGEGGLSYLTDVVLVQEHSVS